MKLPRILRFLLPLLAFCTLYIDDPDGVTVEGGGTQNREDSTSGTVGTGNAARLALMDAINDQNDEADAADLSDVAFDDKGKPILTPFVPEKHASDEDRARLSTGTPEEDPPADDPNADEPVLKTEPTESEGGETDVKDTPPIRIKVNGQEIDLTPDLIAKAQKIASADQYLEEAATARKAAIPAPTPATPATPERDVEAERLEEEQALVRALQMGTPEEAVAALRKIRASTGISRQDVETTVSERLKFETALTQFRTDYKDVVSDPFLNSLVVQRDKQLLDAEPNLSYSERYKRVGDEVRAYRDDMVKRFAPAVVPPPPAVDPLKVKLEKKQAAPQAPAVAAVRSAAPPKEEDGEEDPRSVIAQMAKSRGGPGWLRA